MDRRRISHRRGRPKRRYRYHGFTLGDSEQDRVIATFIDTYEGDLSKLVKTFLYEQATGTKKEFPIQEMMNLLDRIYQKVQHGVTVEQVQELDGEFTEAHAALSRFMT